jgi:quercetin dioxygenase-like cupin family protein
MIQRAMFFALALAGLVLAGIASREVSARAASVSRPDIIRSQKLFESLKACEVPGVHEHLLAHGVNTLAYAGEFTPTRMTPWTTGNVRIFLYIVSGHGVVRVGNTSTTAGPGDFFVIPKGARHAVSATAGALRALYFEDRT